MKILPLVLIEAGPQIRERIYSIRHEVYARELNQHPENTHQRLIDRLDEFNRYIVALDGDCIAGFISITPPGDGYSIDKYFPRRELPFPVDESTYEIRLLTVVEDYRYSDVACALMVAAFRWIEARDGKRITAIGRHEIAAIYRKLGMHPSGLTTRSGAVRYDLMQASVMELRDSLDRRPQLVSRLEKRLNWQLQVPLRKPAACFHGGASFDTIGAGFDSLEKVPGIIAADVLDAWFLPAPGVLADLTQHLSWALRTSPPTGCEGLIAAIATARGVSAAHILPGAGSSDLIFRALPRWLSRQSRTVLLDPTYGEYAHVLEKIIGCQVERLPLQRSHDYRVEFDQLLERVRSAPDLIVLVNPNSPTGQVLTAGEVEILLQASSPQTRIWVDETYIDYTGGSVERLTTRYENLIVCKSMSKVYALSGARVAYLCAAPHQLEELRALTPPWVVSLPAQLAAVRALQAPDYYHARIAETHSLRAGLARGLRNLGWEVIPGSANFLLAHPPEDSPVAAEWVAAARRRGLFLRDPGPMGATLGNRAIRIAVKDAATNRKMIAILRALFEKAKTVPTAYADSAMDIEASF